MYLPSLSIIAASVFMNEAPLPDINTVMDYSPHTGDLVHQAQMDTTDALRLLLCAVDDNCREALGDSIKNPQRPNLGNGITLAGQRRVNDGQVSPDEIGNHRGTVYFGSGYNNRNREIFLWDVDVQGYGIVCLGTYDKSATPALQTMDIVSTQPCSVKFSAQAQNPNTPRDRITAPRSDLSGGYNFANGDNSTFGNFVSVDGEGFPFVAMGRHNRTGEVGCFYFEHRVVEYAKRIDHSNCADSFLPTP